MEDKLVEFETAKLAKEVGFDEFTYTFFNADGGEWEYTDSFRNSKLEEEWDDGSISRPTQSLLQRWLRETHNIELEVTHNLVGKHVEYCATIYYDAETYSCPYTNEDEWFTSYEAALEDGLKECCKVVKTKR